jgi:hypothetical protein
MPLGAPPRHENAPDAEPGAVCCEWKTAGGKVE